MTMRYAHLAPAFLAAEVRLLDPPTPPAPATSKKGRRARGRKGQRPSKSMPLAREVRESVRKMAPHLGRVRNYLIEIA
jgi:hypothetical protein